MGEDERFVAAWWEGIELWYNHADYESAMNVWFEAMDERILERRSTGFHSGTGTTSNGSLTSSCGIHTERIRDDVVVADTNNNKQKMNEPMARFLVFLAGCALDSRDIDRARDYLDESLRRCAVLLDDDAIDGTAEPSADLDCCSVSENIAHRAAHEYAALFEEDERCESPHRLASELFQTLFQRKCRRAPFMIPSIISKPFYNADEHPHWCKVLQDNAAIIQKEFDHLWDRSQSDWHKVGSGDHRDGAGQHDGTVVEQGGDWREVVLFAQSGGHPELAPRTAQLVRDHCADEVLSLAQAGAGEVIFSVLRPGTRIYPHIASHNLRLTAHLGLRVPHCSSSSSAAAVCSLRVGGVDHVWEEGKFLVFDDSFEHSVVNESDEYRAVLLVRFWHPELSAKRQRVDCLNTVLRLKEEDGLRRYNPPIPPKGLELPRGMKRSHCFRCLTTGFDSIRVDIQSKSFCCSCGEPIGKES